MGKPRVGKWFGIYRCVGMGIVGYGESHAQAYGSWRMIIEVSVEAMRGRG